MRRQLYISLIVPVFFAFACGSIARENRRSESPLDGGDSAVRVDNLDPTDLSGTQESGIENLYAPDLPDAEKVIVEDEMVRDSLSETSPDANPFAQANALRVQQNIKANARVEAPHPDLTHPVDDLAVLRGFDGSKCRHQAIDIYSNDKNYGIGKPVYAITRAKVVFIGTPQQNPARFGRLDRRRGYVKRAGAKIPRRMKVPGYGWVYPFTLDWGRSRTGVFIVTQGLGGVLDKHKVRYMHLSAPHPDLRINQIVERGQEIGIQGSTAILSAIPHLHLDVEAPDGKYFDSAPLLGLQKLAPSACKPMTQKQIRAKARASGTGRYARRHKVRRGESLWSIGRKYGVSVKSIRNANRMRSNHLKPGQHLSIPARTGRQITRRNGSESRRGRKRVKTKHQMSTYVVKKGDSLWKIAKHLGTTVGQLRKANRMRGTAIKKGMRLVIPKRSLARNKKSKLGSRNARSGKREYTVKPGDSLWKLAKRFKVSVHSLRRANRRIKGNKLKVGQVLTIP